MTKYIPYDEIFHRADIVKVLLDINSELKRHHAIFRITLDSKTECLEIVPSSTVWLEEFGGAVINVSRGFKLHLDVKLSAANCRAEFNNTSSCFVLVDTKGDKK